MENSIEGIVPRDITTLQHRPLNIKKLIEYLGTFKDDPDLEPNVSHQLQVLYNYLDSSSSPDEANILCVNETSVLKEESNSGGTKKTNKKSKGNKGTMKKF